jgi:arylsulfatase A-like enzyme
MRYPFPLFLISLFLLFSFNHKENPSKPNVLIILTDDQGYGDLGIHGNTSVKTPNLDRLGMESARLDRFYVSPLCAPTRASLLTGRYHLRTGVVSVSKGLETMNAEEYTLAEFLQDQGYRTGIFGKWHNGQHHPNHPLSQGFEEFTGFSAGHWSNYFNTLLEKNGQIKPFQGYLPDILTNEAIDFIRKNKGQPFFTYLSLNTPHSPHQVPDEFFQTYKQLGLDDELASIYGMVSNVDKNVGRLMDLLKELKLEENTLVLFLTDNGPNGQRYNAGMKGVKGSVHEGGVRVPSFWRWPGKIRPGLITAPAAHIDVFPTISDFLGVSGKDHYPWDGISLKPLFEGEKIQPRSLFTHVAQLENELKDRPGAIRKDSLLLALLPSELELYDLKNDPQQKINLSSTNPYLVTSLEKEYQAWLKEVTSGLKMERKIPVSGKATQVVLPTYESQLYGDLKFFEGHGWAQDWVTNWKNEGDSLTWSLEVLDPGWYEVWVDYTALPGQVGAQLQLKTGHSQLIGHLSSPFTPTEIPSPDRVPRKEAPEQTWTSLYLGKTALKSGPETLTLTATHIKSKGLGELFSIRLIPSEKEHP